jgi:hypothetical protein
VVFGGDAKNYGSSADAFGIGYLFEPYEIVYSGFDGVDSPSNIVWMFRKKFVDFLSFPQNQMIKLFGDSEIFLFYQRSVSSQNYVWITIGEKAGGDYSMFKPEKDYFNKISAPIIVSNIKSIQQIERDTIQAITSEQISNFIDIATTRTGCICDRGYLIESFRGIKWGYSGVCKICVLIPLMDFAHIFFLGNISDAVQNNKFCVGGDKNQSRIELNEHACSTLNLSESEINHEKEQWKYFRLRFHNWRASFVEEIEHGSVQEAWGNDLDISKDGILWYHLMGECYDDISMVKPIQ